MISFSTFLFKKIVFVGDFLGFQRWSRAVQAKSFLVTVMPLSILVNKEADDDLSPIKPY